MNRFQGKNIIITGGSAGIGLAVAHEFARLGGNLFLLARRPESLAAARASLRQAHPDIQVHTFVADVADRERINEVIREIGERHGGIHTIINNAGISGHGRLAEQDIDHLHQVMEVNHFGAINVIQAAWPYLTRSEGGHIGFVSSVAGYLGLLGFSAYSPSKFALTGLAECIRMEAREKGLSVTIIYPPDTQTDLLERGRATVPPETQALSKRAKVMSPEAVAAAFVKGIRNNRFEVYGNFESVWIRRIRVLWPRFYFRQLDRIATRASQ